MTPTRILFTPPTLLAVALLALTLPVSSQPEPGAAGSGSGQPIGEALFARDCAGCHEGEGKSQGPSLAALQQMGSDQVMTSLTSGKMMEQAEGLSPAQILAIVSYLAGGKSEAEDAMPASAWCTGKSISVDKVLVGGWGVDAVNSRHQPSSSLSVDNVASLEIAWVFALPDVADARSQPVITEDTVFVAAVSGGVFALDRATGCIKWDHDTGGTLRTSMSIGMAGERKALFFGDMGANIYALDAITGESLWRSSVALSSGSVTTGTPVPHSDESGDRLFVPLSALGAVLATNPKYECCKSHGAVVALDLESGELLWTYKAERGCELDLVKLRAAKTPWPECPVQYSFSAAPMSSPDVVFAGALSGKVFAFSAESGEILWQDHTVRPYDSINGIPAHGGAIDSSGVQLADDMLFVQSGYSYFGQIPGNALIAYRLRK